MLTSGYMRLRKTPNCAMSNVETHPLTLVTNFLALPCQLADRSENTVKCVWRIEKHSGGDVELMQPPCSPNMSFLLLAAAFTLKKKIIKVVLNCDSSPAEQRR